MKRTGDLQVYELPRKKMANFSDSTRFEQETSVMETANTIETFTPREYQVEILEAAKKQNTIACLGTGTGKTFIAVLLIREMADQVVIPFKEGGKKIFFLVPTVPLVHQQANVIRNHTELKVGEYCGEMNVDTWSKSQWEDQFIEKEVLVMTAEICRIILEHCFLPVSSICLLIFDECHRANGNDPYCAIMSRITSDSKKNSELPRIFGLSASLLNKKVKPAKLEAYLKELESTLMSVIVTASDYAAVQKCATDPDEVLVLFNDIETLNTNYYTGTLNVLMDMESRLNMKNRDISISNGDNPDIIFFRKPYQCLVQLKEILLSFGPWFACCAAKLYCKEIQKLLSRATGDTDSLLNEVLKTLETCIRSWNTDGSTAIQDIPHKLKKFLEIFNSIKNCHFSQSSDPRQNGNETPLCVVFVEKRITAYVLCQWMNEIGSKVKEFDFMNYFKADFIVGHGSAGVNSHCKESSMNVKKQEEIIRNFRERKFNVLIATSVVEEGMDIQKCNVVIRFDLPMNFRSYIQSKGRARAMNSKYVVLLSKKDHETFIDDLLNYKTIEKFLVEESQDRDAMTDEEMLEYLKQDLLPPYQPETAEGSPRITMASATSLLNRYCSRLPCDMATRLTPRWKLDDKNDEQLFRCTVWLPINSPLRQAIIGELMPQKKLAKMAAALKACEMLHKIGELNDHLLPFSNAVDNTCEELGLDEEISSDGTQPGTHRRRQLYKKKVADVLKIDNLKAGHKWYLHVIQMDLTVPLAKSLNCRGRPLVNPADSSPGFALLTRKVLPHIPKFPIFTKVGKIQISVKQGDIVTLNSSQLSDIVKFHKFLFAETLYLEKEQFFFDPESSDFGSFVVPVKRHSHGLDLDFVEYTLQHVYHQQRQNSNVWNGRKPDINKFDNAVVTRTYIMDQWNSAPPVFHYVTKILADVTSNSPFGEDSYATFKEFYKYKYDIDIRYEDLPLLEVERCTSYNFSKPLYVTLKDYNDSPIKSKTHQKHANFREYLVPELCLIHPFPGPFFRAASYLPSILYRMNQLLLAESIRVSVASTEQIQKLLRNTPLEWPVFNFESSDKKLREHLIAKREIIEEKYDCSIQSRDLVKENIHGEIVSFEKTYDVGENPGPSPGLILMALTTKSAADEFNLERLETIGDSFLKYVISVALYSSYPNYDEGKLTQIRSRLIRNLNLYQKAKAKRLPECLFYSPFDSRRSWLPPGYRIEEDVYTKMERNEANEKPTIKIYSRATNEAIDQLYSYQLISDKNVADAMEALIGAYLLSSGYEGALQFMHWLNLYPKLLSEHQIWPPNPPNPRISHLSDVESKKLLEGFGSFETRIKYKFKEPAYLLQAFTHPSYYNNEMTDCFQRLEFLGDAILDYLITRKLFDDPKEHSPGKLTDLRSALVNNGFFASLAVKYGYHKNLKCWSITLCKQIDEYIHRLKDTDAFKMFEVYGYSLEELESFDSEEVEIPKVLGDLFESVAGAIYLDSGSSLDAVWRIYYPMIKPALEHQSQHVPMPPVRKLVEMDNGAKFSFEDGSDEKSIAYVTLSNGATFTGTGPNKKTAKKSAAKRAVHYLAKRDVQTTHSSMIFNNPRIL